MGIQQLFESQVGRLVSSRNFRRLKRALKHRDKGNRVNAAIALGEIGDKNAVNALLVALLDKEPEVRQQAAKALKKIGDPAAAEIGEFVRYVETLEQYPQLVTEEKKKRYRFTRTTKQPVSRHGIFESLVERSLIDWLITALDARFDTRTRITAINALTKIGDNRCIAAIIELAESNDGDYYFAMGQHRWVRAAAAKALGEIGGNRAISSLIGLMDSDYLDDKSKRNMEIQIRKAVHDALVHNGDAAVKLIVQALPAAKHPERHIAMLDEVASELAATGLASVLVSRSYAQSHKLAAVQALGKTVHPDTDRHLIEALIDFLENPRLYQDDWIYASTIALATIKVAEYTEVASHVLDVLNHVTTEVTNITNQPPRNSRAWCESWRLAAQLKKLAGEVMHLDANAGTEVKTTIESLDVAYRSYVQKRIERRDRRSLDDIMGYASPPGKHPGWEKHENYK